MLWPLPRWVTVRSETVSPPGVLVSVLVTRARFPPGSAGGAAIAGEAVRARARPAQEATSRRIARFIVMGPSDVLSAPQRGQKSVTTAFRQVNGLAYLIVRPFPGLVPSH